MLESSDFTSRVATVQQVGYMAFKLHCTEFPTTKLESDGPE